MNKNDHLTKRFLRSHLFFSEEKADDSGNFCDHCNLPATKSMIYINKKTKKRYCVDCRAEFRKQLILKGM